MWKTPKPITKQIKSENVCPGCLVMELEAKAVDSERIELYLGLQFNEDKHSTHIGSVKFGIRSGELHLDLSNATVALSARELSQLFPIKITKEIETQTSNEKQNGVEASLAEQKPSIKGNKASKKITGIAEKYQIDQSYITSKGDQRKPIWVFETHDNIEIFKHIIRKEKLATANIEKLPCIIEAKFVVDLKDIRILDGTGAIPKTHSKGKVLLEKFFIKRFLLPQFQPYLSLVVLEHG